MSGVGLKKVKFEQPASFEFNKENLKAINAIIAKYPADRKQSAVMPMLDIAQRQNGGWIPAAAVSLIAKMLAMPEIKVYEVATFYSMYNLQPVGKYFLQVCRTTPCWLRGSDEVTEACKKHLNIGLGETSSDGMFTLVEVECLGACVNAPILQVNDDYYEDLNSESTVDLLKSIQNGQIPAKGSVIGRQCSAPVGGKSEHKEALSTVKAKAKDKATQPKKAKSQN